MAATSTRLAGFTARLYHSTTIPATVNATNVGALAVDGNQVLDVAEMGAIAQEANSIDVPVYGAATQGSIAGQRSLGTFTFNVTATFANTVHAALRDDNGNTRRAFVVEFREGSNRTYAYFVGTIASASVSAPIDDRVQMDVEVSLEAAPQWFNNT